MQMTDSGFFHKMEQEKLSCSICLDLLKDPVTIPCGHSFCMNCIKQCWDGGNQKKTHSCPLCRQKFKSRPDLVKNTILADLVEEARNRRESVPADLCDAGPGDVSHYQSPAFEKHQLVDAPNQLHEHPGMFTIENGALQTSYAALAANPAGSHTDSPCGRGSSMGGQGDDLIFSIVLLGQTGTGKSASANTILTAVNPKLGPNQLFASRLSSTPVTSKCEIKEIKVFGRQVRVVDTPDFFDEDLNSQAHLEECKKYCQPGSCVVLLVIQMGQFLDGERGILERLEEKLGWRIRESTIVLLTHGENAKGHEESFIAERTDLRPMMQACGNRYHVFKNTLKKPKQVKQLLKKIPDYETIFPGVAERTSHSNCHMS